MFHEAFPFVIAFILILYRNMRQTESALTVHNFYQYSILPSSVPVGNQTNFVFFVFLFAVFIYVYVWCDRRMTGDIDLLFI